MQKEANVIDEFSSFLKATGVKGNNYPKCLRFVRDLSLGVGVKYLDYWFMRGTVVDIRRVDVAFLQAEATRVIPPERNKANGWAWNHQITKIQRFQEFRRQALLRAESSPPPVAPPVVAHSNSFLLPSLYIPSPPVFSLASPLADLDGLIEWYESCRESDATGPTTDKLDSPSANARRLRCLGHCPELWKYVTDGHCSKGRGKRLRTDATKGDGDILFHKVKEWLKTLEGKALLAGCEIEEGDESIDHAWSKNLGGPDHLYNYHLMPTRANCYFRDRHYEDRQKRTYMGELQYRCIKTLAREGREKLPWGDLPLEGMLYRHR